MYKSNLVLSLAEPVITRLGTAAAAALVGYGMSVTQELTVAQAITVLAGVAIDLVTRKWFKR